MYRCTGFLFHIIGQINELLYRILIPHSWSDKCIVQGFYSTFLVKWMYCCTGFLFHISGQINVLLYRFLFHFIGQINLYLCRVFFPHYWSDKCIVVQGYTQRMRLEIKLYRIYTVCFSLLMIILKLYTCQVIKAI